MPIAPPTLKHYYSNANRSEVRRPGSRNRFESLGTTRRPKVSKSITFSIESLKEFGTFPDWPIFAPRSGGQGPEIVSKAWAMEPQGCLWLHSSRASLSQFMISWWLTKAFVAKVLLLIYLDGSTTKCKQNKITIAIRSNYVVIIVPLWVDHKM